MQSEESDEGSDGDSQSPGRSSRRSSNKSGTVPVPKISKNGSKKKSKGGNGGIRLNINVGA